MQKLRCVVKSILFQNPLNAYAVIKAQVEGQGNLSTVVGVFYEVEVGNKLLCEGSWRRDAKFGVQFSVTSWEEILPDTLQGIESYLCSNWVKGIGPHYADLIVKKFGEDTIHILDTDINQLATIPGIAEKRIATIRESWEKHRAVRDVMMFLNNCGVSTVYAVKIYDKYGKDCIKEIKANPYRLADDIWGIGFKMADEIALKLGYSRTGYHRCSCGMKYVLEQFAHQGHVFAREEQLLKSAVELLMIDELPIREALDKMKRGDHIDVEGDAIYLRYYYDAECYSAERLITILKSPEGMCSDNGFKLEDLSRVTGYQYDDIQKEAIRKAMDSKVMVLTGGPGTGKTTTTLGIISALKHMGLRVVLAAPTGRAAKRMHEATGMEAKTIHRLLEYNPEKGFQRNIEHSLEGDALIVDECSMIDVLLMSHLVEAIPDSMRLILVGDVNQLPSVGPGNVLRDIIDSQTIPVVRLSRVFRQSGTSRIVISAHAINDGAFPDISNKKDSDFFFIQNDDENIVANEIVNLVQNRLPKAYGYSTNDIQVLAPMQKGVVGTINLNHQLQDALNPTDLFLLSGNRELRVGDRVMQLRNNYEKKVFNGDLGYVVEVNKGKETLFVCFEKQPIEYKLSELDELALAYATTIHKSQGSEYPVVVIPVVMGQYIMLQRNLIYTGITRAKKLCVLIGSSKALSFAINNMAVLKRNTKLCLRLREQ